MLNMHHGDYTGVVSLHVGLAAQGWRTSLRDWNLILWTLLSARFSYEALYEIKNSEILSHFANIW